MENARFSFVLYSLQNMIWNLSENKNENQTFLGNFEFNINYFMIFSRNYLKINDDFDYKLECRIFQFRTSKVYLFQ